MVIPEDFYQCNLKFTGAAVPRGAQLTFGGFDGSVGGLDPSAIAVMIGTYWNTTLRTVQLNTVTLAAIRVKKGPNDTGPMAEVGTSYTGAQSADAESPQVAILVRKNTALGGRENRGRWFLPGARESYVTDGGAIDSSGGAAIQTQLTAFLTALSTNNVPMHLLHNSELTAPTQVTSLSLQYTAASQRRRLRRVGGRRTSS